jgi:hypothetical protein
MSADILSLDYTTPRRQDIALAIACMRAHAKTMRRAMMSATAADDAVARLENTQRISEAAQRLELALSAMQGECQ